MVASNGGDIDAPEEGEVLLEDDIRLKTPPALGATFDPARHKAETARRLAYGLLVIFAASILAAVVMGFVDGLAAGTDLAETILPYTGGPLAVALGFYFGASS